MKSNRESSAEQAAGKRFKPEAGKHYYYNEKGYMVFTAEYLLLRGFCCGNGCKHCPYEKKTNL